MTTTTDLCLSCEVGAGRHATAGGFIHESQLFTVTHHAQPEQAMAGFLILQPRRHVEHIAELSSEEAMELGPLLKRAGMALMDVCRPEKVYVCSFGSAIKHVHFYLIPPAAGHAPRDGAAGRARGGQIRLHRRGSCAHIGAPVRGHDEAKSVLLNGSWPQAWNF